MNSLEDFLKKTNYLNNMTTYKLTVMHPGGTTYDYTVKAKRYYLDGIYIVFIKEDNKTEMYPQGLTIVKEQ